MKRILSIVALATLVTADAHCAMSSRGYLAPAPTLKTVDPRTVAAAPRWGWENIKNVWERLEARTGKVFHNIMGTFRQHHEQKQLVMMHEQQLKQLKGAADTKQLKQDHPAVKAINSADKAVSEARKKVQAVGDSSFKDLKDVQDKIKGKHNLATKAVQDAEEKMKKASQKLSEA